MAKMKQLLVDLEEYRDEIDAVISRMQSAMPHMFETLVDGELADANKDWFIEQFTTDKELARLVLTKIELENNA